MIKATGVFAFFLLCLSLAVAQAAPLPGKPDPANGLALARSLCVNCHQVEPGASDRVLADVPTFREIAHWPGITAKRIEGFILDPHPAMPQVQLTREELADLAAYILSLQEK